LLFAASGKVQAGTLSDGSQAALLLVPIAQSVPGTIFRKTVCDQAIDSEQAS